jgi:hypothetical protein
MLIPPRREMIERIKHLLVAVVTLINIDKDSPYRQLLNQRQIIGGNYYIRKRALQSEHVRNGNSVTLSYGKVIYFKHPESHML